MRHITLLTALLLTTAIGATQAQDVYICKIKGSYGVDKDGQIDDFSNLLFGDEEITINRETGEIKSKAYPLSPRKTTVISRGNRDEMFIAIGSTASQNVNKEENRSDAILVQIKQYARGSEKPFTLSSTFSTYQTTTGTCIIDQTGSQ